MKVGKGSHYTEQSHLAECSPIVGEIYAKLKTTFLNAGSAVKFKPAKGSIRVWIDDRRNIAEIFFRRETLALECRRLVKSDTDDILKYHEVAHYDHPGITCERVKLWDTNHWDEIEELVARLLRRHRAVLPNLRLPTPGASTP